MQIPCLLPVIHWYLLHCKSLVLWGLEVRAPHASPNLVVCGLCAGLKRNEEIPAPADGMYKFATGSTCSDPPQVVSSTGLLCSIASESLGNTVHLTGGVSSVARGWQAESILCSSWLYLIRPGTDTLAPIIFCLCCR